MHRRQYLATTALAAVGLAGCSEDESAGSSDDTNDGSDSDGGDDAGPGTATPVPEEPPTVQFSFEYDPEAGELTVTHMSGEHAVAGNLYARGENTYGFEGTWPASNTSTEIDGQPAVTAGNVWAADAEGDVHLKLVWESGSDSSVLAEFDGPNY